MSMKTKIQWCDSTVNPTMGCDGCELWSADRKTCYAGMLHLRYGKNNPGFATTFEDVTHYPGRMAKAARWSNLTGTQRPDKPWMDGLPRLIFVSDMSDSLSKNVPFEFLHDEIITNVTSEHGRRHRWLWLTKRPERMANFSGWLNERDVDWPDNLWAGTSITSQATTSRIQSLLKVGDNNTIRFLSVEPQVESIALSKWLPQLDWIIQGGESGAKARPFDIQWATDLIGDCKEYGVPYFLKQLGSVVHRDGERVVFKDSHAKSVEGVVRQAPNTTVSNLIAIKRRETSGQNLRLPQLRFEEIRDDIISTRTLIAVCSGRIRLSGKTLLCWDTQTNR